MLSKCYKIARKQPAVEAVHVQIIGNNAAQHAISQWVKSKTCALIVTGAIGTGKTSAVKQRVLDLMEFDFDLCSVTYVQGQFKKARQDGRTLFVDNCHCFMDHPAARQVFLQLLQKNPDTVCIVDPEEFSAILKSDFTIVEFKPLTPAQIMRVTLGSKSKVDVDIGDARQALIQAEYKNTAVKDQQKSIKYIIRDTLAGNYNRELLCDIAQGEGVDFGYELMNHVYKHYTRSKKELGQFGIAAALSDCDMLLCEKRRISEDEGYQFEYENLTEIAVQQLGTSLRARANFK